MKALGNRARNTLLIAILSVAILTAGLLYLLLRRDRFEPVTAQKVNIQSSGNIAGKAKPGDAVNLIFEFDRELKSDPHVTIAGKPADLVIRSEKRTFQATRILTESDESGEVAFSIELYDRKGAVRQEERVTTDGSLVQFDPDSPYPTDISLQSNNDVDSGKARAGDTITLRFSVNEPLLNLPDILIGGQPVDRVRKSGDSNYEASRMLDGGEEQGLISFSIAVTDGAGNTEFYENTASDGAIVVADSKQPVIRTASLTSTNRNDSGTAGMGDRIVLRFSVNEQLSSLPRVRIGGLPPEQISRTDEHYYEASRVVDAEDESGRVGYSIIVVDGAGNTASVVNRTTDGTRVVIDRERKIEPKASKELELVETGEIKATQEPALVTGDAVVAGDQERAETETTAAVSPEKEVGLSVRISLSISINEGKAAEDEEAERRKLAEEAEAAAAETAARVEAVAAARAEAERIAAEERAQKEAEEAQRISEQEAEKERLAVAAAAEAARDEAARAEAARIEAAAAAVAAAAETAARVEAAAAATEAARVEAARVEAERAAAEAERLATATTTTDIETETVPAEKEAVVLPEIVIETPADKSSFGKWVEVGGKITQLETIESITYEVSPLIFVGQQSEILEETIEHEADGSFSFTFATENLSGDQKLVIRLLLKDGTNLESKIALYPGESDIPSFAATPIDNHIQISWANIPNANRIRLLYTDNGTEPGEDSLHSIDIGSSPYMFQETQSGKLYALKIEALDSDGELIAASSTKHVIPFAPGTINPISKGRFEQVELTWNSIEATTDFEVFRAVDLDGEYENISGIVTGTRYRDHDVGYGKSYYYRIKPAHYSAPLSSPVLGESLTTLTDRAAIVGDWSGEPILSSAVSGGYLFAAAGEKGVFVFDISNPKIPINVGAVPTQDARAVAVFGNYVYVADGARGLKILDIDSPTHTVEVGSRKTTFAQSVVIGAGDSNTLFAYVADGAYGLKTIDVTNPKSPERVASIPTQNAFDLALSTIKGRRYLFLADGEGGVKIFDPTSKEPVLVGEIEISDARAISVVDGTAYIADRTEGLLIFDVSFPENPRQIGRYAVENAVDVTATSEFAYVADGAGNLLILDTSISGLPVLYEDVSVGKVNNVVVKGSHVYTSYEDGIYVLNTYTKGTSIEVASALTDGNAYGVSVAEAANGKTYAYVADHRGGLKIYDITKPSELNEASLAGFLQTEYARDVTVSGDLAFVADGPGGLKIVDISPAWDNDPATPPVELAAWDTDGNTRSLFYENGNVFIADGNRGIKVIDVRVPKQPTQLTFLQTEYAVDIQVADSLIYLADGDGGLGIYRFENNRLVSVSETVEMNTRGVALRGDFAYVVGSSGLMIYDISRPESPKNAGFFEAGYAEKIAVDEKYAYIAEGIKGLRIVDIRKPESPYIVSVGKSRYAVDVAVRGPYAFVVDSEGLKVIEILVPSWLTLK